MDKLVLRRATPADAERVLAWRNERSAGRYQPLKPTTIAELQRRFEMEGRHPIDSEFSGTATFIVDLAAESAGWITLREVDREHRIGDIGYTIGEAFRKRGLATAAIRKLLPTAFLAAGLERLQATAAVDNIASRRSLERAGFTCEGISRAYLIVNGRRVDHARYALLRAEWRHTSSNQTSKESS